MVSDVVASINQLLPEPHAGLLAGILYGVRTQLPRDLTDALIRSGTLHIVALSGMNITILSNLTALTLLPFFSRKISCLLTVLIIIGFVVFVGPSPSIVRAAIMGSLTMLSVVFGRQHHALVFLCISAVFMIVFDREMIRNISFQLSFLATLGLIVFQANSHYQQDVSLPLFHRMIRAMYRFVRDDIRTTLSAQVFVLPIFIFQFHRVSILSPLANLLISWIIPPIMVLGLMMSFLAIAWFPLAIPFSWVLWLFLEYLLQVIFFVSGLPLSSIDV